MKAPILLLLTLTIVGCQTMQSDQYVVPAVNKPQLKAGLSKIADNYGLDDQTARSTISNTIFYSRSGDTSFTDFGARLHQDSIVVDIQFRSAGSGEKLFHKIKPELESLLVNLYGSDVKHIEDVAEHIPIN